jgi:hypothetical protein
MALGELAKMKLVAYPGPDFTPGDEIPGCEYDVLINPESYSLTYGTETNNITGQGSSESISQFRVRPPQNMTFKFVFDGSGVVQRGGGGLLAGLAVPGLPSKKPDVVQDFNNFKSVVYNFDSDTHSPRYVQLRWGPLIYNCQLVQMTVNFKLFSPDGTPVRAEANCTFQSVIDPKTLWLKQDPHSPDLSHIRTVKEGDTLPLLCFREYGDSKYYYQVARVNNLNNLKELAAGTKLIFPPIVK